MLFPSVHRYASSGFGWAGSKITAVAIRLFVEHRPRQLFLRQSLSSLGSQLANALVESFSYFRH
jgi:hypothetical protein